ncbi:hypothetical protein D3C73_1486640 [compost metagenome]
MRPDVLHGQGKTADCRGIEVLVHADERGHSGDHIADGDRVGQGFTGNDLADDGLEVCLLVANALVVAVAERFALADKGEGFITVEGLLAGVVDLPCLGS